MSGIPPQLDVHPGTPTGEWAVKTTSALQPQPSATANAATTNPTTAQLFEEKNMRPGTVAESTFAPTSASVVSTPGQEFPGAYPNKQEAKPVGSEIAETVAGTANSFAQSVSETAQTYVPAAAEMIGQYLPKSVTDKMSEYIPGMTNPQGAVKASENDIVHDKSLPSTELTGAGAREHVGGVGALPGSLAESSVTKLPEERAGTAIPATVAGAAVAATEAAKGTAEKVQNTAYDAKDRVTHGGHTTAIGASSVPSRELDGAKPGDHSSGVGALPGSINEPGVARLPDEKGRGITGATSASVGTHSRTFGAATLPSQDDSTHGVSGGVGALPGLKDESGVAVLPDERPSRETGTNFSQSTPSKVGETAHIAEVARQEGIRSSQAQSQQPITKQEKKEEGKAGAAAVGAAVGEKFAKDEHAKDSEKKISSGIPNKGDTYETDYHPADLHPAEADYSKEHKEQAREAAGEKEQEKPLTGAKHADSKQASHAEGTGSATDDTEKAKKVGFMTKMKGEAKILLGKVEGKKGHDKVEEGQKIKAGEATTAQ